MNQTGLSRAEIDLICAVFKRHVEVKLAVLFGSRAKGTAKPNSDIDIGVQGIDDALGLAKLSGELDELPLPYRFDILALSAITNPDLRDHIERVGLVIYRRDSGCP